MELPDIRQCVECGEQWSYAETGSVACPACGSIQSVSAGDHVLHTDEAAELDLGEAHAAVDDRPLRAVASLAIDATRTYTTSRGFISRGDLLPLDDEFVAAAELRHAAGAIRRRLSVPDAEELYFLELLDDAPDGERPTDVPDGLRPARGLAIADAVGAYRADVSRWLDEYPDPEARRLLGAIRDHGRRIEALDGDVPMDEASAVLDATRSLGVTLRGEDDLRSDEPTLDRIRDRLPSIE